jgi:excisionase family DNA binding protein
VKKEGGIIPSLSHREDRGRARMIYLTPRELSERFKISERQVTKLARSGILPGIKIGKLWRFKISEIEEWERHQGYDRDEINFLVNEIVEETNRGRR